MSNIPQSDTKESEKPVNPFTIPSDMKIFKSKVIEAINSKPTDRQQSQPKRPTFRELLERDSDEDFFEQLKQKEAEKILITKQSKAERALDKEGLVEFVNKKREMFLIQYALNVKQEEIKKLEGMALKEEEKLLVDEKLLEEDAMRFDTFLKENDKNSVEAIKSAEQETKAKMEKIQESKKISAHIASVRSEISRNYDILKDLEQYKAFIDSLAAERHMNVPEGSVPFEHPEEMLSLFADLEEKNLTLIQHCQESEQALDEIKQKIVEAQKEMNEETSSLKSQIETIKEAISKEKEKGALLDMKTMVISSDSKQDLDAQEKTLVHLCSKIKQVYTSCIGDEDATSTLVMLAALESQLERLLELIESIPSEKVEKAEKLKEKERRIRLREEKLEQQRQLQEERIKRALERAKAPIKKRTGKPIMFRSAPLGKKEKQETVARQKEDDDNDYYW